MPTLYGEINNGGLGGEPQIPGMGYTPDNRPVAPYGYDPATGQPYQYAGPAPSNQPSPAGLPADMTPAQRQAFVGGGGGLSPLGTWAPGTQFVNPMSLGQGSVWSGPTPVTEGNAMSMPSSGGAGSAVGGVPIGTYFGPVDSRGNAIGANNPALYVGGVIPGSPQYYANTGAMTPGSALYNNYFGGGVSQPLQGGVSVGAGGIQTQPPATANITANPTNTNTFNPINTNVNTNNNQSSASINNTVLPSVNFPTIHPSQAPQAPGQPNQPSPLSPLNVAGITAGPQFGGGGGTGAYSPTQSMPQLPGSSGGGQGPMMQPMGQPAGGGGFQQSGGEGGNPLAPIGSPENPLRGGVSNQPQAPGQPAPPAWNAQLQALGRGAMDYAQPIMDALGNTIGSFLGGQPAEAATPKGQGGSGLVPPPPPYTPSFPAGSPQGQPQPAQQPQAIAQNVSGGAAQASQQAAAQAAPALDALAEQLAKTLISAANDSMAQANARYDNAARHLARAMKQVTKEAMAPFDTPIRGLPVTPQGQPMTLSQWRDALQGQQALYDSAATNLLLPDKKQTAKDMEIPKTLEAAGAASRKALAQPSGGMLGGIRRIMGQNLQEHWAAAQAASDTPAAQEARAKIAARAGELSQVDQWWNAAKQTQAQIDAIDNNKQKALDFVQKVNNDAANTFLEAAKAQLAAPAQAGNLAAQYLNIKVSEQQMKVQGARAEGQAAAATQAHELGMSKMQHDIDVENRKAQDARDKLAQDSQDKEAKNQLRAAELSGQRLRDMAGAAASIFKAGEGSISWEDAMAKAQSLAKQTEVKPK